MTSVRAQGNDIVLCDGGCSRAYHERCVVPRLVAAELSEDDGWLCPACDAKARTCHSQMHALVHFVITAAFQRAPYCTDVAAARLSRLYALSIAHAAAHMHVCLSSLAAPIPRAGPG